MNTLKVILGLILLPVFLYVLVTAPPAGLAIAVILALAKQ